VSQLANANRRGQDIDERGLNFMLSVIKGIEPRDQLEAMLAAQMAVVHVATMTFARRLAHEEEIGQVDSAERAFNKLTRTFAMQMEALRRYRSGAEQRVTLQHVSVVACRVLLFCVSTVSNVCTIKGSVTVQAEDGLEPLHVHCR
jgi:hypothetical protein